MSTRKAAGIETEYGIIIWGATAPNLFFASQLILNAHQFVGVPSYPKHLYNTVEVLRAEDADDTGDGVEDEDIEDAPVEGAAELVEDEEFEGTDHVDTEDETGEEEQGSGSNGKSAKSAAGGSVTYGIGSLMLANGARFYIDHAHPEYSTPETSSPRYVVAVDKAGERIVARCLEAVNQSRILPDGQQVMIYKNNSDYKGNSYGCHENYLLHVDLFEDLLNRRSHMIYRYLLPFLISRVVICGAGKVGYENKSSQAAFQLSQRADFFETLIGLQTTHRRPLFNTRDEPHAHSKTYRRLHVILGDANMSELATYLKIGTMQLVLHMLEDGFIKADLTLARPIEAFQLVSRDLSFSLALELENGQFMTAVDIQAMYLDLAEQYLEQTGGTDEQWDVWNRWAEMIETLRQGDWQALATRLDWAIKKNVLDRYLSAQQTDWETVSLWQPVIEMIVKLEGSSSIEPVLAQAIVQEAGLPWEGYTRQREVYFGLRRLDLEYHDVRCTGDQIGLFYRLQQRGLVERLLTDEEIERMVHTPPPDTRAWLRGKLVEKFADAILGMDWSYIRLRHIDPVANLIFRLEFPDPFVGTEQELAPVWDYLDTPDQIFAFFHDA